MKRRRRFYTRVAALAAAIVWMPACLDGPRLSDANGSDGIPTGAPGGECDCDPMDAAGEGDCVEALGTAWDGTDCVELRGCGCEGEHCDVLFERLDACLERYAECYAATTCLRCGPDEMCLHRCGAGGTTMLACVPRRSCDEVCESSVSMCYECPEQTVSECGLYGETVDCVGI